MQKRPHWKTHLQRAIALKGSQDALARAIGCSQGKISWHLVTGKPPTAEDAMAIERATNGVVLKSQLRPDIWTPTVAEIQQPSE